MASSRGTRYIDGMNAASRKTKPKPVSITSVGTTVWGRRDERAAVSASPSKFAPAKKAAAKTAAKKAPAKKVLGLLRVTIFDTPLRPRHATRATLAAAARSVK